jgi:hypothetical protein
MILEKRLLPIINAAMIGKGEWLIKEGNHYIEFPLAPVQREFFKEYIYINELNHCIAYIMNKNIMRITVPEDLKEYYILWYKDHMKVPNIQCMDPYAILLAILLFSERLHHSLDVKANIDRKYLPNIAYYMEHHMGIPVEPHVSSVRIYDITTLFLFATKYLSIYELNLFLSYLEKSERENLVFHFQSYKEKIQSGGVK